MFHYLIDLIYLLLGYEKELPATQCRRSQLLVAPKVRTRMSGFVRGSGCSCSCSCSWKPWASAAATAPRAPPAPPIPVICCNSNATGLAVCPLHLSAHDMFVFAFWPGLAWRGPHPCPCQLPSVLANFHSRRGNSLTLGFQFRAESNQKCAKFQLPRGRSSWTRRSQMKGEDQEPAMSICLLVVNWPRVMKNNVRIYSICLLKGYA